MNDPIELLDSDEDDSKSDEEKVAYFKEYNIVRTEWKEMTALIKGDFDDSRNNISLASLSAEKYIKPKSAWLSVAIRAMDGMVRRQDGDAFTLGVFYAEELKIKNAKLYICRAIQSENDYFKNKVNDFRHKVIIFKKKGGQVVMHRALAGDGGFKEYTSTMFINNTKSAASKLLVDLPLGSSFHGKANLYLRFWPFDITQQVRESIFHCGRISDLLPEEKPFYDLEQFGVLEGSWWSPPDLAQLTKSQAKQYNPSEILTVQERADLEQVHIEMQEIIEQLTAHLDGSTRRMEELKNHKREWEHRRELQSAQNQADEAKKRARIERNQREQMQQMADSLRSQLKTVESEKLALQQDLEEMKCRSQIFENAIDDLKRKVGAKQEAPLNDPELERYQHHCLRCLEKLVRQVGNIEAGIQHHLIQIQVPTEFSLSTTMAVWFESWNSKVEMDPFGHALFSEHFIGIRKALVSNWTVIFKATAFEGNKSLEKEITAEDYGGPCREFFTRFFEQLGDLSVKGIRLFEMTKYGYVPLPDEFLKEQYSKMEDKEAVARQMRLYFRALGRIFVYCLIHQITIPSNALPTLYWNILLCGLFPKDKFCSINLLIDGAAPLLDIKAQTSVDDMTNVADLEAKLFQRLGIDKDDNAEEAQANARDAIHDFFVEGRSLFLENVRQGLSLGGEIDFPSMLGLVPPRAIKKVFLAQQSITVDDLFRIMEFDVEDLSHATDEERQRIEGVFLKQEETHGNFQIKMREVFCKRVGDDATFLNKFVHLCTGQAYLPDPQVHKDFRITFEFNSTECGSDHCPSVHTCDNVIKIPSSCYNLDMDVFLQKLDITMELAHFGFDMQ